MRRGGGWRRGGRAGAARRLREAGPRRGAGGVDRIGGRAHSVDGRGGRLRHRRVVAAQRPSATPSCRSRCGAGETILDCDQAIGWMPTVDGRPATEAEREDREADRGRAVP